MVGFNFYAAQALADGDSLLAERMAVAYQVKLAHEPAGVIRKSVVAFFEFVSLFNYGCRNNQVVVFELPDGFVVVQDDIRVEHVYL